MAEARNEAKREVQAAKREAQELREKMQEEHIAEVIRIMNKLHVNKDVAKEQLMEEYALSEEEALEKIEQYW